MNSAESYRLLLSTPYRYALDIANIIAPSEYGDIVSTPAADAFFRLQRDGHAFPFTKDAFNQMSEIQTALFKLRIDPDAFWEGILLLEYMAEEKFNKAYMLEETEINQVRQFVSVLETPGASLMARKSNGRRIEITNRSVISKITEILRRSEISSLFDDKKHKINLSANTYGPTSQRVSYEARILITFFKIQHSREHGIDSHSYRNPLKLISQLLYFMRVARDEGYMVSSDRLKGDLKAYPNPGADLFSQTLGY